MLKGRAGRMELVTPSSFGHGGASGCILWIDPVYDVVVAFVSNRHARADPDGFHAPAHACGQRHPRGAVRAVRPDVTFWAGTWQRGKGRAGSVDPRRGSSARCLDPLSPARDDRHESWQ